LISVSDIRIEILKMQKKGTTYVLAAELLAVAGGAGPCHAEELCTHTISKIFTTNQRRRPGDSSW
jgi:hypothetical protein